MKARAVQIPSAIGAALWATSGKPMQNPRGPALAALLKRWGQSVYAPAYKGERK